MCIVRNLIISLFLLLSFSLYAQQSLTVSIALKLKNLPGTACINTQLPLALNQWIVIGDISGGLSSSYNNKNGTFSYPPLGMVKKVNCKYRSLILWKLSKESHSLYTFPNTDPGVLMNELMVIQHCKVFADIAWRKPNKIGQAVNVKTKNIEATTTVMEPSINVKPSGRFIY